MFAYIIITFTVGDGYMYIAHLNSPYLAFIFPVSDLFINLIKLIIT